MRIFNLGETAITIELENEISVLLNDKILSMYQWLALYPFKGLLEIIPAYSSLTLYYNPFVIKKIYVPVTSIYKWVEEKLIMAYEQSSITTNEEQVLHRIPVCYDEEFGIDLITMTKQKKVSKEKIIEWHTSETYRVYMIGFLPGFPYLGEVVDSLVMKRKQQPVLVEAGSVGIAGRQTGIYPLKSPGGWNIIGRTPVSLFEKEKDSPVWMKPGDSVQFYAIDRNEWIGH